MNCQNCQEPLEDSAAFCPECGTPRPANRTCIHCGSPVKAKQKFCSACGKSPELTCQCGATLKPEQKFCKGCGKKVEQSSKKPLCPECGAAIEDQGQFCPDCGAAVANTSATSTTGTYEPPEGEAAELEKIQSDDNVEEPSVTETKITEPVSEGASTTHECAKIRESTASDGDAEELTSEDYNDDDDDEEEESESETEDVEVKQPAEGGDDVEEQVTEDLDSKQLAETNKDCEVKEPTEGGDDVDEQVPEDLDSKQLAAKTKDGEDKEPTEGGDDVEEQVPEDLDSKQLAETNKDCVVKEPTEGGDDVEEQVPEDLDSKQLAAKTEDGEVKESAANRADGKESTTREEGGEELLDKTGGSSANEEDTDGTGVYEKVDGGADVTGVTEEKYEIPQDADGKKEAFGQSDTGETKPETPTAEVEPVSTNEEAVDKATSETGHETNEVKEADPSNTSEELTPAATLPPGDTEQLRESENITQESDKREDHLLRTQEDEESHGATDVNENERDGQDDSPPGGTTEPSDNQPIPVQDEQPPIALPSDETRVENNQGVPSGPDNEAPDDTDLDHEKKKEEAAAVDDVQKTQGPTTDGASVDAQKQQAAEPVKNPSEPEKTPIQETGGGASAQTEGAASEKGGDDGAGATGSSSFFNSKTDDGNHADATDDDTGDEEVFEADDGESSRSRESSQQRGRGGKARRRPQKLSSRKRKNLRKRENQQKQQQQQQQQPSAQPSATVKFHVVISKQFKQLEANNHRVYLSLKPDEKHPSPENLVEMHPKEKTEKCGGLYEGRLDIKFPRNTNKIFYKYCVELDGKYEWEKIYHQKGNKNKDADGTATREVGIPKQHATKKEKLDVYDWVAYPSGLTGLRDTFKSWTGLGKSSQDTFARDLPFAWALFLPSPDTIMTELCTHVDSHGESAEGFLRTVKVIAQRPPPNFNAADTERFVSECVENALLNPLLDRLKAAIGTTQRTSVVALFVLLLYENVNARQTSADRNVVFRAMLIQPDLEKKTCPDISSLHRHFPGIMKDGTIILSKLQHMFVLNKEDRDPSWICCIPLLHLLSGDSKEFQPPPPSDAHRTERWWGMERVQEKLCDFQNSTWQRGWSHSVQEVFQWLERAFQADQLMLRTFVATLNFNQLQEFLSAKELPAEIVMGSLFYHLNTDEHAHSRHCYAAIVDILKKTAAVTKTTCSPNRQMSAQSSDHWRLCAVVGVDLLEEVTRTHRCTEYLIHSVVLLQMAIVALLIADSSQNRRSGASIQLLVDNTMVYIEAWLNNFQLGQVVWTNYRQMMEESFQAAQDIPSEELQGHLKEFLSEHVNKTIHEMLPLNKLTACLDLLDGQSYLSDVVATNVCTYLEDAFYSVAANDAREWFFSDNVAVYMCFLKDKMSQLFTTKWNEYFPQPNGLLELVFNWRPLLIYMNTLTWNSSFKTFLSDEVATTVEKSSKFLRKIFGRVCDGGVKISELQWLVHHRDKFCGVVHTVLNDGGRAGLALQLREKDLEAYQDINTNVNCALQMCRQYIQTDDAHECCQQFQHQCRNTELRLSEVCQNQAKPDTTTVENYKPQVCINSVPDRFQRFLPNLAHRQNSAVFRDMLKKCARSMNISPENKWWDVMVSVWSDADTEWNNASQAMKSGHITLDEAEKLFCVIQKNDKWLEKCNRELESMARECGGGARWVKERMEQFQCLSQISRQREAAKVLCQIKEEFGFTGDVENIRSFQEVDMEQPIANLNQSVVGTSKALEDIDNDSVVSFKQFGSDRCSKFVTWVRETMAGDGMKEVKVFVDMALNYVGDEPREMDKVRNLRDVVTGYAPLIFQSGSDATFLDRCSEVARNIRGDKELPDKLESTVDLVDWFDNIHKFHGSVEKTAMAQVDSITTTGILKIGRLQEQLLKGKDLSFSDVICLEVPEKDEGKSQGKTYSYQDLVDLQSRLMLVVGQEEEGKSNVERFISVMDSVVRLVKTYIELCRSGCLLFLNWAAKFFFDTARGVCCIVEFFQGEETVTKLKGRQESYSLEQYMAKVADFLDRNLENWLIYVSEQRGHFEELNLFTMDQLVFLQEELVVIRYGDVSRHVYPLISLLLPRCPEDILQDAVEQASEMDSRPNTTEDGDEEEDKDAKEAAQFIQHMKANGFSQKLAVKALKDSVDPTDFDEGLTWCMNHADEDDDGEDERDAGDTDEKESLSSSQMEGTIASALQILDTLPGDLLSLEVLATHLNETWALFLQRVKFSGEDFLSLPHLGNILKILADKGVREYGRKLPPPLETHEPNLIVCPRRDVLKTVTSLYMFTKDAPLPQPDEVLLCTPNTTSEEVSMFLRRAFSKPSTQQGKIHCLAFADSLDYEVGARAERDLKEFIYTTRHPYQLVVVCTSENEFNAQMTASLEKYGQSPPIAAADEAKMLEYLYCKFTVPEDVGPNESAACFDPDRLCVRVVRSARSGMGKTLYKNRLVSQLKNLTTDDDDEDGNVESDEDVDDDDDDESDISEENAKMKVHVTVPLYQKQVNSHEVAATLLHRLPPSRASRARLIHLDVAYEVQEGVDQLLYNLLVLGCITDVHGYVWRRSSSDLYLVEAMPLLEHTESQEDRLMHQMFSILPSVKCCSPQESLAILEKKQEKAVKGEHVLLFDSEEYRSTAFQRPFHYLSARNTRGGPQPFNERGLGIPVLRNESSCLRTLIKHCGVKNPSWSELNHFVSFLNKQLEDFEHSIFCSSDLSLDLPGFPAFVLRFLIHMSRDFATRSIEMAEESLPVLSRHDTDDDIDNRDGIEQYQMRRTWESSPHPYTFFNPDQTSMTFLGFAVDPHSGSLMDQAGRVLEGDIMTRHLYHSLVANGAPISEDFDRLPRPEKLQRLYQVMGVPFSDAHLDPDNTYELTTDNAKKILAIYMRFRCNIPVIVMGETGCGKTRLVQFMCALQNPKAKSNKTMVIMKVHGGTTAEDIYKKVREAEAMAKEIKERGEEKGPDGSPRPIYTVLFFDEANTTEAIGAIKEVMCDGAMNGKPIKLHENLKMVAACNPYRKHLKKVIERLEKAGLGYHVSAEKTCDKLGRVPMRQLVYRVQPLPQSMLPLVWDLTRH